MKTLNELIEQVINEKSNVTGKRLIVVQIN